MQSSRITTISRHLLKCQSLFNPSVRANAVRNYATRAGPVSSIAKPLIIGIGLGVTAGTAYTFFFQRPKPHPGSVIEQEGKPFTLDKFPDGVKITRRVHNPKDDSGIELVLFQFQTCPYCCKVRSYLDYRGFSYSVVEVDAVLRQSIKWSPYKKVPLMLARTEGGKYVQLSDSSMIVSSLETYLNNRDKDIEEIAGLYPNVSYVDDAGNKKTDVFNKYHLMFDDESAKEKKEVKAMEKDWRSWADDHLVHLISPNVYRSKEEALATFEWFSDVGEWDVHFPAWEQKLMVYGGAAAMYMISKRLKKRHQLGDDVRGHLYDACDKWMKELKKRNSPFLGGQKPNLGDLAVFGVLCSMEGCQAFSDCLEHTQIGHWFYDVKAYIGQNRGTVVSLAPAAVKIEI